MTEATRPVAGHLPGPAMARGTVTEVNADGFGFIAPDRHAGEIWVSPRSLDRQTPLHEGQRVEYTLAVGTLGIEAAHVRPLDT